MGAPQWGQNLLSLAAPQTGQTLKVTSDSSTAGSSFRGLLASSWAIRS